MWIEEKRKKVILKELAKGVFLNARILSKHNVIPKILGSNFRCCVVFEVPKNFLKKKKEKKKTYLQN